MRTKHALLIFIVLTLTGCVDDEIVAPEHTLEVTVSNADIYTYATGISGDEAGAKITKQVGHFDISALRRTEETQWEVVYFYKPAQDFTGSDLVEIETFAGSKGASAPTEFNTVKILINVTE